MVLGVGPQAMLSRMRYKIGVRYDAHDNRYGLNWVADLFNCKVCMATWLSVPLAVVGFIVGWQWVAPLAAIGFVAVVEDVLSIVEGSSHA
jgi:hypothetical protein